VCTERHVSLYSIAESFCNPKIQVQF
jgi:hypothetical protein